MLDSDTRRDVNFRSPRYWVGRTEAWCWHCRELTPLLSLALPPGHFALDEEAGGTADVDGVADTVDAADAARDGTSDAWSVVDGAAFLFYVEHLPPEVRERLARINRHYRPVFSEPTAGNYWANHCKHCEALLEDHELFCEPDGAFLPTSEAAAAAIHLLSVEEPFEAVAGGHAVEPQFFDSLGRS